MGALVMLAAGVIGYVSLSNQLSAQTQTELEGKRALLVHLISKLDNPQAVISQRHEFDDFLNGHEEMSLRLSDEHSGVVLYPAAASTAEISPPAHHTANKHLALNGSVPTKKRRGRELCIAA